LPSSISTNAVIARVRTILKSELPYILAYKSQNLPQNLDLKVGGATYMRVIKSKEFVQPPKYAIVDRVEPRDSVLFTVVARQPQPPRSHSFPSFTVGLP